MLGQPRHSVADIEEDVRRVARKSIVARRRIAVGDTLSAESLALKRPAGGIAPKHWHEVIGRVAGREIPQDTPLQWEMFD